MFKVGERFTGIGNVIASKVSPFITDIANRFLDAGVEADVLGTKIDRIFDGIAVGVGMVLDSFRGFSLIFNKFESFSSGFAASYLETMADINDSLTNAGNKMRSIFGGEQLPIDATIRQSAIEMRGTADAAATIAANLANAERPSIALGRAIAQVRLDAVAAAQAAAENRRQLQDINVPTFEESEVEARAREREEIAAQRLQDQLASKLERVQASLLEQEQIEALAFLRRQEIVQLNIDEGLISEERGLALKAELFARFENKLTSIANKGLSDRLKFQQLSGKAQAKDVFSTLESITAGVATSNKTMFRINQAAAIANAIINTYEGVTKTLAKYPWPLSGILAAFHLAAGLAQVSAIRSASFGGGTTPSAAGSTPTFNNQPLPSSQQPLPQPGSQVQPTTQITIIVEGSLIGDEGIRQILRETLGELVDADEIFIAPESAQASVIRNGTGSGG